MIHGCMESANARRFVLQKIKWVSNNALHLTTIPLRSIVAGELCRSQGEKK